MKFIPLSRGLFAKVDDSDFEELSKHKWYALKGRDTFYACRQLPRPKREFVYMHRQLAGKDGLMVDHENRDGLDNQRHNLRVATRSQNNANSKSKSGLGFKGIRRNHSRFAAAIRVSGKLKYLGTFDTPEEAHAEYFRNAQRVHGAFARSA